MRPETAAAATHAPRVLIVGGGIAGASLAYMLTVQHGVRNVTLLEREAQCGMHTTGRSAALYMQSYGPPGIRALTVGSHDFYTNPPAGFAEHALLAPRGALYVAQQQNEPPLSREQALGQLEALEREVRASGVEVQSLSPERCLALCPVLRPDTLVGGIYDPQAQDMDVDAILQGFLRGARHAGARIIPQAEVTGLQRLDDAWQVHSTAGLFDADVVVNAAGAWAEQLGQLAGARPIGLVPKRRSAFVFDPPPEVDCRDWPLVIGASETYYFKPDAGALLGSPANADPAAPHDVQPEELDIATGIWAIEQATTLTIRRPRRTWAGLRSFVADGEAVSGYDAEVPGFYWLAAQGGYGIQSAPGLARASAALLLHEPLPEDLRELGLQAAALSPARLQTAA